MKRLLLLLSMLVPLSGGERDFIDPVGFSTTREQIKAVVECARQHPERPSIEQQPPDGAMIAAICPHDDHIYAGPLYIPIMDRVMAKHLILIGVFHKARKWDVENLLVFEDFQSWKGPLGPLPVDNDLRSAVIKEMPEGTFVVSNEYHQEEHSLEAFVAFIQYFDPEASILPILVPYMGWERMEKLAEDLSHAVSKVAKARKWKLGEDFQIIISNDSVHYGDQGWGGKNFAPFGVGTEGLMKAKEQDMKLLREFILGTIEPAKLETFFHRLVDEKDIREYKITWCGRFSVPFGLNFVFHLAQGMGKGIPKGHFMGYGTSVELGELPVRELGLGVTAPANLHHWVGYASAGFFVP